MGIIDRLFRSLFGSNNKKQQQSEPAANDYMDRWEKERQERMKAAESRLKDWVIGSIKEKGSLPFTWESGSDEAFITFKDSNEADEENFQDLEEYIVDKLEIPDAGDFEMTGSGAVYIEGNFVRAKYSSTMRAMIDYNEETEQAVYSNEEEDGGDKLLFSF